MPRKYKNQIIWKGKICGAYTTLITGLNQRSNFWFANASTFIKKLVEWTEMKIGKNSYFEIKFNIIQ